MNNCVYLLSCQTFFCILPVWKDFYCVSSFSIFDTVLKFVYLQWIIEINQCDLGKCSHERLINI